MKRRLAALLLAALMLSLGGCAAIFDREYYVSEPYEAFSGGAETDEDAAADSISNYASLLRALTRLVEEHAASAQLQFQNYEGTISQDISTACWEVKSSTAVGAFAVDYISYDLSRIISYYQAEIYITYKRSEYQLASLEQVENTAGLADRLDAALRAGETYLVLGLTAASVTDETVRGLIGRAYYADARACPVLPAVNTAVFPESGMDHIVEITLDYGTDGETLAGMRGELDSACAAMLDAAAPDADAAPDEIVAGLCRYLAEHCAQSEAAGDTAYDALCVGAASSEGAAMALEAGCQAAGIECTIVFGRRDNRPRAWNIVTIGQSHYHVDAFGGEDTCLAGDAGMLASGFWWDADEYPVCEEDFVPPGHGWPERGVDETVFRRF